ncbi:Hypothetical predicted protein [Podarcis lilfordi]|uniref:Uncharacterized protein n=1 Tax=Podarcis lilfordi TaxID=74358 RepID=A0AA35KMI4_9SAUR|nr:Hypothetical predicted protein [Podarcis lilfordi]
MARSDFDALQVRGDQWPRQSHPAPRSPANGGARHKRVVTILCPSAGRRFEGGADE